MSRTDEQLARANRILGALPMSDFLTVAPHLEPIELQTGDILQSAGSLCTHAYFPVDAAITLVAATRDGEMSELALIGREGVVGLPALLGASTNALQSVVLRPGRSYRLPAAIFVQLLQNSAMMQALAMRYVQNIMRQMAQGVVCSLHHSVLQRLSSWLLYHHTVTDSDQVRATHETIAHMLGVRRESVTQAAGLLQKAGCLSTSRGRITLHDPQGLRAHVCECFSLVEDDHRQLWHEPQGQNTCGSVPGGWTGAERPLAQPYAVDGGGADARYADIYDFAPVGLLSVDSQGQLIEANMSAAILLGISRSQCREYRFVDFLQSPSRDVFDKFHQEVLSGKCRRHCELGIQPGSHRAAAVVRLEAVVDESGEESRMVMIDVTDSHRQLTQLQYFREHEGLPGQGIVDSPDWWIGPASSTPGRRLQPSAASSR